MIDNGSLIPVSAPGGEGKTLDTPPPSLLLLLVLGRLLQTLEAMGTKRLVTQHLTISKVALRMSYQLQEREEEEEENGSAEEKE